MPEDGIFYFLNYPTNARLPNTLFTTNHQIMKGFRLWLMLAGISLYILLPAQNNQTRYELAEINVKGNTLTDARAIVALTGLRVGDKLEIPGPKITNAIKSLWDQHLFEDVQIYISHKEGTLAFLEVEVQEATRLANWHLKGLKKQDSQTVQSMLEENLVKGERWSADNKIRARQLLFHHFQKQGYAFATVNIEEEYSVDSSFVQLNIRVDKGKKQKINTLKFEGNHKVSSKKLRKQMRLKGSFLRKESFVAATLKEDKERILRYYHSLGFKDAAILGDSLWKNEQGQLHLRIKIEEGNPYYIGKIDWVGNSAYPTHLLESILNMKPGDVYDRPLLEERLFHHENGKDVSSLYLDNGYLFLNIDPIEKGIKGNQIDLEIRIAEGAPATISEVKIKGNTQTHEEVIRRELYTLPGQSFSRAAIIHSQRALMSLGYFDPEKLGVSTKVDPEQGTVAITYELEERRSEQIELSAGWNPSSGQVVGTLGLKLGNFSLRNLLRGENWNPLPSGEGQILSLRLQSAGAGYQGANFTFSEPWLGGKRPNLFSMSGFYQRFTNGESADSDTFNSLEVVGGSIQFGTRLRAFNRMLSFSTEISAQHIYLNEYRDIILDDGMHHQFRAI